MKIPMSNDHASYIVPGSPSPEEAVERTTHMGIGAHPDDLEVMALDGIFSCFDSDDQWFSGITVTDGAGSVRTGPYASCTEEELIDIRRREQRKAAVVGEYSIVYQLAHASSSVRDPSFQAHVSEIQQVLKEARPDVVYTHTPADRHPTHVAVSLAVVRALQEMPADARPETVFGCEVWRDLDWLCEEDRVVFDLSGMEHLRNALVGVFDSQIRGGKRYDRALSGRHRAHATFHASHEADAASSLMYGMDLTPAVEDGEPDLEGLMRSCTSSFQTDVLDRLQSLQH